ncbi:hypothetical protein ACGFRG_03450 [Streptomyces sp. NPDC048696]|uniref:hypothetical protein n=1 Tax=Streptomyces sp. NPDC048696 TaxID=3365585 RepID=UPI00371E6731
MSPVKIAADTAATPTGTLNELMDAVRQDPSSVATGIKARVEAAQNSGTVVMMGGWTD